MLTSKGASGVTGAGFVTLAIAPDIPIQSVAIILGIDKFMGECHTLTNVVGNGVTTVAIGRWHTASAAAARFAIRQATAQLNREQSNSVAVEDRRVLR